LHTTTIAKRCRIAAELDALQAEVDALRRLQARPPPTWPPCSPPSSTAPLKKNYNSSISKPVLRFSISTPNPKPALTKIYIQQDGQKTGPFTNDELREKTYSGELSRSTLACAEGEAEWLPLETLLSRTQQPPPPTAPLSVTMGLEKLRDPKEKTTLVWLYIASVPAWLLLLLWCIAGLGIPLVIIGIIWLFIAFGELWFAAYLKTNAVQVSETQLL